MRVKNLQALLPIEFVNSDAFSGHTSMGCQNDRPSCSSEKAILPKKVLRNHPYIIEIQAAENIIQDRDRKLGVECPGKSLCPGRLWLLCV